MLPFKTILFATDFSPASNVAFNVAAALARDYRARMIALHVVEPVRMGFSEFAAYVGPDEDKGLAMETLQAIKAPSPTVTIEHRLLEGDPASVIVETAAETGADLIVMGTMGRTGLSRLVMGSVAEEVLRRSPCPVLTIRGTIPVRTEEPAEESVEFPETVSI
jgi:nucleotide-binding universal stress UspA family protein